MSEYLLYMYVCMYVDTQTHTDTEQKNEVNALKTRLARLEATIDSLLIVDGCTQTMEQMPKKESVYINERY